MSAEEDIRKTISQFANSFNLKDWALMESALADVLTVDYSDLRGVRPRVSRHANTPKLEGRRWTRCTPKRTRNPEGSLRSTPATFSGW